MSLDCYEDAVRPKVQGTLNLHQQLSPASLDFFILLSSCAGIIGNDGQANYASACTFQDAFARYCTRLGKPTRSLDLGMIEGAGYVHFRVFPSFLVANLGYIPSRGSKCLRAL